MMTRREWRPKKLNELGFVGRGKSRHRPRNHPSLYGGPYPFVQTGDIKAADLYLTDHSQTYSEKGLAQSKLWDPGTLCITIAANIAETAILGIRACFPDSVVGFIPYEDQADVRFIKYYIDIIKLHMQNVSHGATQDNLSLDKLLTFDLLIPDIGIQRKIAGVLSAYDDLIENNSRRIGVLEQMARAIYREWFVDFRFPGHDNVVMVESELGPIPEGWEVRELCQVGDVNARSVKPNAAPETISYIDIASVSPGCIDTVQEMPCADAPGRARRLVKHGDIIWSTVRPSRRSYALIHNPLPDTIVSTGFAVISATAVPFSYLYEALTTDAFVGYLVNHAKGSAYPAVNKDDFDRAQVLVPPALLLERFDSTACDLLSLANNLRKKNSNLRQTRDLLLPKLVSGEVDVSDLDITQGGST